jgi:HAE1 family hydrophobic/amphiphilic exporter-1
VGDLQYFGNRQLAFRLWLDPVRLAANKLTATDVVQALRSQNRLVPVGQIGGAPAPPGQQFTFTVKLQGRLRSTEDFTKLILRNTADGGVVRLGDVGRVTLGGETFAVEATDLRGVPSVGMAIYQLTGSNALDVSKGVEAVIQEFTATMPVGMTMQKIYDNTDFVRASIEGVTDALRDAVILVVLVLFLFLQDWKATLVPAIAIPVALVGSFMGVLIFGFTLNQLTLFGLVLATGLVVDDAITIIENTSTNKAAGMGALAAAKSTMDGLFGAVIATSLVLLAVFGRCSSSQAPRARSTGSSPPRSSLPSPSPPSTPSPSPPCSRPCCWAGKAIPPAVGLTRSPALRWASSMACWQAAGAAPWLPSGPWWGDCWWVSP